MSTDPKIINFFKQQIAQLVKQGSVEVSGKDQTIYFFTGGIGVDGNVDGNFLTMPASYVVCQMPNIASVIEKTIAAGKSHIAVYKTSEDAKETVLLIKK